MAKKGKEKFRSRRSIKSSLVNYLREHPSELLNYKQIAARLGLHAHAERDILVELIDELLIEGSLEEIDRGKYKPILQSQYVEGKVDMTKSGSAFVLIDGMDDDVYIGPAKMHTALHGDQVKVLLYAHKKGRRPEGEIVEIIERKKIEFAGILQVHEKFAFLLPDDRRMVTDIFVPLSKLNEAKNGEKAIVKIIEWAEGGRSPIGEVIKVLGKPGEHSTEMNAIIAEFNLPEEFPNAVIKESERISEEIPQEEIEKRWDFRNTTTFTIDPVDAKDFDDALSIKEAGPGLWEIGIHIADVTWYVREETHLDKEALDRGTSVYLVDRVIPMLPEKLSNVLCSLRPNEDKLSFSVVLVMDENAKIVKEWYGRTIINSDKRFAYEDAQKILEEGEGEYSRELLMLNKLAYKLRAKRFAEGAISFETEEVKFKLDENGKPLGVYKKVRQDAHKLIEDFMLLANRKVAEYIFTHNKDMQEQPFVFRVHDRPNEDKLAAFSRVAASFGYKLNLLDEKAIALSLNKLLTLIEGKPEQNLLQSLAIRSMAKAFYTTTKTGHYGLSFDYYTHFTSPIRRYPDMIAHRLLAFYLSGGKRVDQEYIEAQCKHSSEMEVRAADAERASIKYKQVEYMLDKVGMDFEGIISGVTEWGIYVEMIETKCEGMVRISELKDDYYIFDEDRFLVRGYNSGNTYQLGDILTVKVAAANLQQRTIDLVILDKPKEGDETRNSEMSRAEKVKKRGHGGNSKGGKRKGNGATAEERKNKKSKGE